ncbi:hypothetical protein B0T17DRAFT_481346 [Bombardia bombarda]|uniref:DUF7598 domain-containing protein n=1 Tax=Bombardia bombarda TaxID=252184 RepID=A0AA39XJA5_9PEZI|nr:hypothetical protein B0T17DRAFT_481346 [Bombardia bombarda]
MFNLGQNPKVRGAGLLVLNGLRAFTIISLLVAMVGSWAMIVMSGLSGHFAFFDTATHFFVSGICVFLIISELCLFKGYFERNWPVLSPSHSLAFLGLVLIIIGCQILGDLTKEAYNVKNLGLAMWRLVISAGILSIAHGFFNLIASLVFRDSKGGITARHIRSSGYQATPQDKEFYDTYSSHSFPQQETFSQRSNSFRQQQQEEEEDVSAARRFTRKFNPMNFQQNFRKSRQISKPIIITDVHGDDVERGSDRLNDRNSPVVPTLQRPPTALHPAFTGGSRYSEAHMDRF